MTSARPETFEAFVPWGSSVTSGLLVPWVSSDPSVDPLFGSFVPELAGSWSLAASSVPSAGLSATWGSHLVCKEEGAPLVVDNLPVLDMKMASDSHPAAKQQVDKLLITLQKCN